MEVLCRAEDGNESWFAARVFGVAAEEVVGAAGDDAFEEDRFVLVGLLAPFDAEGDRFEVPLDCVRPIPRRTEMPFPTKLLEVLIF